MIQPQLSIVVTNDIPMDFRNMDSAENELFGKLEQWEQWEEKDFMIDLGGQ